jgi:ERCC4-related helicase
MSTKKVRTFKTGAIRDLDDTKEDYIETISWRAFRRYAKYMTGKKSKYGAGNFKKGIPIASYEQSLVRHLDKYLENKYENGKLEPECDHLSALIFNIFGIMHEENK